MSIERTYYCEGPDCGRDLGDTDERMPCHARSATPPPHLPSGFIETRTRHDLGDDVHHFCGWDCLTKYAAAKPLPIIIPWDQALGMGDD